MTELARIAPQGVRRVTFFKRDEVTTDLICCEVSCDNHHWVFHEEMDDWQSLLALLSTLPNFSENWYEQVSQPPFAPSQFIAFDRPAP